MKYYQPHIKKKLNAGFTLVELMVSIGIMILITTVVLVNYGKFDTGIILTNLAYDMGLSIRKAQSYGISVKGVTIGGNQSFTDSYGIHFDSASPTTYTLFVDVNGNHLYDTANQSEKVESYMLGNSYRIVKVYQKVNGVLSEVSAADITFKRPNPDATSYVNVSGSWSSTSNPIEIVIASTKDLTSTKAILVYTTGQISIQ